MKSVKKAQQDRDTGMQRAEDHAERVAPGWVHSAMNILRAYAVKKAAPFLIEEVVAYAESVGFEGPPDGRAWGAIARRAAGCQVIRKVGYGIARTSNSSPKILWGLA